VFRCLFVFGSRANPAAPDDDELMGITAITYDMRLNILTHLPFAATYGPTMMKYKQMGVDGVTFLYDRQLKELTVKIRCESPIMEDAKDNNQIPTASISNLPISVLGYILAMDGVPWEVIHYGRGNFVTCDIDGDSNNTEEVKISVIFRAMENTLIAAAAIINNA
jgi:hypothetical protein